MKAANEAQNARLNEFSRITEQQLLDLNTTLQTILAQTSQKEKRNCKYSNVDLCAEKRARTLVECLQRGTCGSRTLVECPSAQGSSGARTSVECPTDQRQVSELFSGSTSNTRSYRINIQDETRLLCTSNDKDTIRQRRNMQKIYWQKTFLRNYQLKWQ